MSGAKTINLEDYISAEQAAIEFECEQSDIYNLINYHRALSSMKVGNSVLVPKTELARKDEIQEILRRRRRKRAITV